MSQFKVGDVITPKKRPGKFYGTITKYSRFKHITGKECYSITWSDEYTGTAYTMDYMHTKTYFKLASKAEGILYGPKI